MIQAGFRSAQTSSKHIKQLTHLDAEPKSHSCRSDICREDLRRVRVAGAQFSLRSYSWDFGFVRKCIHYPTKATQEHEHAEDCQAAECLARVASSLKPCPEDYKHDRPQEHTSNRDEERLAAAELIE